MSIVTAAVTKSTPDSKVGVVFDRIQGGNVYVKKILDGSLFAQTDLRVGMEILEINGQSARGMTVAEFVALIGLTPEDLRLQASLRPVKLMFTKDGVMSLPRNEVPSLLRDACVPYHKWERIHDILYSRVGNAIKKSNELDGVFQAEMGRYVGRQMVGGFVGFGSESSHEQRVFSMVRQTELVANTASMEANNALSLANALLNPHGIMAQMILVQTQLPIITGRTSTRFHSTNCQGLEFQSIS